MVVKGPFELVCQMAEIFEIKRRVLFAVPGPANGIWVTAAEDQVLRKLDWFRQGGSSPDRQWRDVVGILRIHRESMDLDYLRSSALEVGLGDALDVALQQSSAGE